MIYPHWNLPNSIHAWCTTRQPCGSSTPIRLPYDHFNLALHVGDVDESVLANRQALQQQMQLPNTQSSHTQSQGIALQKIQWLHQVHGTHCHQVTAVSEPVEADAMWTTEPNVALAIMTADCLPILLADKNETVIAAIHAGWRGVLAGIIEKQVSIIVEQVGVAIDDLTCWLGPCIQQPAFQVGEEVRAAFIQQAEPAIKHKVTAAFLADPHADNKFRADLPALASLRLSTLGLDTLRIYNSGLCTYADASRFYSFRRDGQTGRMATVIWRGC